MWLEGLLSFETELIGPVSVRVSYQSSSAGDSLLAISGDFDYRAEQSHRTISHSLGCVYCRTVTLELDGLTLQS